MAEKFEIIGVDRKTGDYQGHPYANIYLHCKTVSNASIAGKCVKSFKIKESEISTLFAGYSLNDLIGRKFTPFYNQYQQISMVQVDK